MRVISKKIYLEPYISRINGTLKSYNEYGTEQTFSTYDETKMNNYGMFPFDVVYNGKVLSYPTLMERYYFCKRYKEMLKYNNCVNGGQYANAVTYYNHNFKYNLEELKKEYANLDATYTEYGGDAFLAWCESILYGGSCTTKEPHFNIPILFTNTIDDLGEFSILCKDWEEGIEYNEGDYVIYDEEVWEKQSGGYGSKFDTTYKEFYFPTEEWKTTTVDTNPISGNIYAIKNGKTYYEVTPDNMADKYKIIKNGSLGFYVVKNNIYKPFETEYITYTYLDVNENEIEENVFVYEYDNFVQLNMKYCYIKGQKLFSKTDDGTSHYFIIDGEKVNVNAKTAFVDIQGKAFIISGNKITVNNVLYNKIDSYSVINGKTYYISNNNIVTFKRNDAGTEYTVNTSINTDLGVHTTSPTKDTIGYKITTDEVYVYKPYTEYKINTISGYTESKLSSLLNYRKFKDDMGNELPGSLTENTDGTFVAPKEKDFLQIPYKVDNVSDLTVLTYESDGKTPKTIFGNKLIKITLYYIDYYGNIIDDTKVEHTKTSLIETSVKTCEDKLKTYCSGNTTISDKHHSIQNDIICEIEYQMGAVMNNNFAILSNGITYKDRIKLIKDIFDYKFDEISSIILNYYKFEYDNVYVTYNEYSDCNVEVPRAYFEHAINYNNEYRALQDGMMSAPIFREEYKLGSSSLENIQSNIYIDRGFSASFEKHLNLLSVKSMESLENFGNGFYNIIES